jgi:hypothetical protein
MSNPLSYEEIHAQIQRDYQLHDRLQMRCWLQEIGQEVFEIMEKLGYPTKYSHKDLVKDTTIFKIDFEVGNYLGITFLSSDNRTFVLINNAIKQVSLEMSVIAHEITHALQPPEILETGAIKFERENEYLVLNEAEIQAHTVQHIYDKGIYRKDNWWLHPGLWQEAVKIKLDKLNGIILDNSNAFE